jgi:hypothetical protein
MAIGVQRQSTALARDRELILERGDKRQGCPGSVRLSAPWASDKRQIGGGCKVKAQYNEEQ